MFKTVVAPSNQNQDFLVLVFDFFQSVAHSVTAEQKCADPGDEIAGKVLKCLILFAIKSPRKGTFMRKHNIFMNENDMLSLQVKRSQLLWLHNKSSLLQQM